METVQSPAITVPLHSESDVLVIGGGFAGISAAVSAARMGQKVILLEKAAILGGLATSGHVCIYLPLDDGLGHKIFGGMAEELLHVSIRYGYNTLPPEWSQGITEVNAPSGRYQSHFNIPAGVMALEEYLADNGVEVVYDALFTRPIMDGNVCKGIIAETKEGAVAFLAKMVVDASGDADVMYRAGADCEEQTSIVSHWTYELDVKDLPKAIESGKAFDAFYLRWIGLRPDADNSETELPRYYGTTLDGVNSYLKCSRQIALKFLKEHQSPSYTMLTLPTMAQFRTTRHIVGVQTFEPEGGVSRPDSVGCVSFGLHNPSNVYEFPYGAVIDKHLKNILAAGRIVACHPGLGWETMRLIPACSFTGQVSGTAAALAIKLGCSVQEVPLETLQAALCATGVMIHMDDRLRDNESQVAYPDPTAQFDPHIRNDNLAYRPHDAV